MVSYGIRIIRMNKVFEYKFRYDSYGFMNTIINATISCGNVKVVTFQSTIHGVMITPNSCSTMA